MARFVTSHDIRMIIRSLSDVGIVCHVGSVIKNVAHFDIEWCGYIDTHNGSGVKVSGLDYIWFAIESWLDGAVITYLNGHQDSNGKCFVSLLVKC